MTLRRAGYVDLAGRCMLVTGCSVGSLGFATAQQLARWGATVVVTTRRETDSVVAALNAALAQAGAAGRVDGHPLDLADAASVNGFTQWFGGIHGGRLDALVNNAGIHLDLLSRWKAPRLASDGFEIHWRTNYLGTVHLTCNLLPLLLQTARDVGEARVVNVVSQLHSRGSNALLFDAGRRYESWQAYGLSKLALMHFTRELHRRHGATDHLKSYSLHPGSRGGTSTNIARAGLAGHPVVDLIRRCAAPLEKAFMASAEEGAQTQLHCATSASAASGHYHVNCQVAQGSADSEDAGAAQRLWDETQAWLGSVRR